MKWWNAYWFRPAPYVDLAMVRICAVSCQLCLLLLAGGYSTANFELLWNLPEPMYNPITILKLFLLPWGWDYRPSPQFVMVVYYLIVVIPVRDPVWHIAIGRSGFGWIANQLKPVGLYVGQRILDRVHIFSW